MNIKDITYFLEVVKEGNFTKAANNLYISQPALSKSVKHLEKEVNTQLIERSSKSFKLTEEGENFYENAKKSMDIIQSELKKLEDTLSTCKKVITLGLPPVIGSIYFTYVIANFKKENPQVDIKVIEEGSNKVKLSVDEERIDLGVVILPTQEPGLETIPISKGKVMLVVSKEHRLANLDKVRIAELKKEKFITFNEKFMMYDKILEICKVAGFKPDIILKTSQWDYIMEMVSLNQGISIMPEPIIKRFKRDDIKMIHIDETSISWDVGFILKKEKYTSKNVDLFIKYTIETVNEKNKNE